MIDFFALGVTHALLLLAAFRLLSRKDLDHVPREEQAGAEPSHIPTLSRHAPQRVTPRLKRKPGTSRPEASHDA
jgi:hypothetical protein